MILLGKTEDRMISKVNELFRNNDSLGKIGRKILIYTELTNTTFANMPTAKIDLITETPETGEFALILVEDGPWPKNDADWRKCLSRIQNRLYDAIDVAIDGHLAAKFPNSKGRKVRVQIDSPSGLPPDLQGFINKMKQHITKDNEYNHAIRNSQFISGLRIVTGHELGSFKL